MNKTIGKLARIGLVVQIMRLLDRRQESRMQRLLRRFERRQSLTTRTTQQLSQLASRTGKQLEHQARALPLVGNRFSRKSPARRLLGNLPLVAGLSLPALSAVSLQSLSAGNMPWTSNRRAGMTERRNGRTKTTRIVTMTQTERLAGLGRNNRLLALLGLGTALGLAGVFVFGRLVRTRGSGRGATAWPGGYEGRQSGSTGAGQATATMQMADPGEADRRREPDWGHAGREFAQANRHHPVDVEVQEAGGNVRPLAQEMPLLGIDLGLDGVQIMLGHGEDERMEHDIHDPTGLQSITDENGSQIGLEISARDGSTTTVKLARQSS